MFSIYTTKFDTGLELKEKRMIRGKKKARMSNIDRKYMKTLERAARI